jgi:hypothetical protein
MRKQAVAFCLSALLAVPALAQTYTELENKANEMLKLHKQNKGNGVTTPWDQKDAAFQAGDIWMQAATLAADDQQRFHAYDQAGLAYGQAQTLGKDAQEAYRLARDIATINPVERARVGLEVARRERTFANYEFVATLAGATAEQRGHAYAEMAATFIVAANTDPQLNAKAVEYRQLAAAQYAKHDLGKADTELGMASVAALKIPDNKQAVGAVDQVFQALLALPFSEHKAMREARVKIRWADSLAKLKENDRALALWTSVGGSSAFSADQREEAWLKAAELYQSLKQIDAALNAFDAASKLRSENFVFSEKIANKKLQLLDAAKRPEQSLGVLSKLAQHPQIRPERREELQLEQARRLFKMGKPGDAETLLAGIAAAPHQAGESILQVTAVRAQGLLDKSDLAGARKAVEAGLAQLTSAQFNQQYRSLQMLSGQLYQHEKQPLKAFEAYSTACRISDTVCQPNAQLVSLAEQALKSALADKKLDEASQIVADFDLSWQAHPIMKSLFKARLNIASGNAEAAKQALAQARNQLSSFYGEQRGQLEKQIVELEAALPKA